jgi:hypothetical protein
MFVAAHISILPVNHLGELCKKVFHGCDSANELKLHRTKCTNIIVNSLAPHFNDDLLNSIGSRHYSILIDESINISVIKLLGITILYFSKDISEVVSTYLVLVEMTTCDAVSITNAIINTLKIKDLSIKELVGIGTDKASVMVGINNGDNQKLKEHSPSLILISCVCHSLQLAVSAGANVALPRHIDFLVKETYNFMFVIAHSTLRQNEYKTLYKPINDGHSPLIII